MQLESSLVLAGHIYKKASSCDDVIPFKRLTAGIVSLICSCSCWDHLASLSAGEELVVECDLWLSPLPPSTAESPGSLKDSSPCHVSADSRGAQCTVWVGVCKFKLPKDDTYHVPDCSVSWYFSEMEKFQGSEGKKEDEEKKYLDVISNKNIKLSERVLIPVKQYPKVL